MTTLGGLLDGPPALVNVGVDGFAEPPAAHGADVVRLDWRPPADGDDALGRRLAGLIADERIEAANAEALERMLAVRPHWVDVARAGDVLPALDEERLLLHAGPPIAYEDMCGPMRAGVTGAALLEGWADTPEAAERHGRRRGDRVRALPPPRRRRADGRDHLGLDAADRRRGPGDGRARLLEPQRGRRAVLRYGALGDDVMERLRWMNERLGPSLRAALGELGEPIDLEAITPRRCRWATSATAATSRRARC